MNQVERLIFHCRHLFQKRYKWTSGQFFDIHFTILSIIIINIKLYQTPVPGQVYLNAGEKIGENQGIEQFQILGPLMMLEFAVIFVK
ncbi:MAG: hypothetical protein LBC56_00365 [Oscillospiraceae bacterium]|nr:hypothetical protein [Oscillospiraceae bacterium]